MPHKEEHPGVPADAVKISVILPVYNTAPYLEKCLSSICAQTFSPIEILVVNDGSTDGSASVIRRFADTDPRIRIFTQENRGLSAARNTGLTHALGTHLMFLDSDDYVREDFCECAFSAAEKNDADLVLFDAAGGIDGTDTSYPYDASLPEGLYGKKEILEALAVFSVHPNAWNKLYRRELFDGIRFPEGENWEDCAVMHLLIGRAERIYVLRDRLYFYRFRAGSITQNAEHDLSVYRWRYLQYGKRYAYLLADYPEIAEKMAASREEAALKFCASCAVSPDKEDTFRRIRSFILNGEDDTGLPIPRAKDASAKIRFGRFLLRFAPGIFRLLSSYLLTGSFIRR